MVKVLESNWIQDKGPGVCYPCHVAEARWEHDNHIMSPVSMSDTILNSDPLEQSSHIVSHLEWTGLNLASLETERFSVRLYPLLHHEAFHKMIAHLQSVV